MKGYNDFFVRWYEQNFFQQIKFCTKESRDTAYKYFSRQPDENRAISLELLIKSKPCIARQIANQFWSGCLLISAKHVTIYLLTWALVQKDLVLYSETALFEFLLFKDLFTYFFHGCLWIYGITVYL